MPKLSIAFCRLDARDDSYTGYSTTGIFDTDTDRPAVLTQEQGRLALFLEREYLTRVAALQDELEAKYEKLLAELTTATLAEGEEQWGNGLNEANYKKAQSEAEEQFPGREAFYYT